MQSAQKNMALIAKFPSERKGKLLKAMALYDCVHKNMLLGEVDPCLGIAMIIANNLGQIHLVIDNHSKFEKCMERLLSAVMFLILERQQDGGTFAESPETMEGFFWNASSIILQAECAGAA
jgi:hypothetical protein